MKNIKKTNYSSLENALRLLKCFTMDEPELQLSELANKLNIAKSTAHRLLSTLASEGFVHKSHQTNLYSIGVSVLALTNTVKSQMKIIKEANPVLQQLTDTVAESSHIGILEGNDVIYLQKIDCEFPIPLLSHLGKRNPIHCTSTGQAILAFQSDETIEKVIENGLKKYTEHTICKRHLFLEKLAKIRKDGYAMSNEELHEGVVSIGAPIYNANNHVIASVNIAGPIKRVLPHKKELITHVVKASKKISQLILERHSTEK